MILFRYQYKNLTWKSVGSVQGNNVLNLPDSFSELKVDILGKGYSYSLDFIYEQLSSSVKSYIMGYGAVASNTGAGLACFCILDVSKTSMNIRAHKEDNALANSTLTVFYR